MLLPRFDFDEPATVAEACQVLSEFGTRAKVIAGGTDLMVNMKKNLVLPERLVSIARIPELKKLDSSSTMLRLGPCLTIANTAASEEIGKRWGALCTGAKTLGSPLVRNRATVGGNLGAARPAADMPPPLMAYGARVVLIKKSGERIVPLDHFFRGPGLTEIAPDEILAEIQVDAPPPYSGAGYMNLGLRSSCDCNVVNVASFITLEGPRGPIKNARIVMGCVGPTPLRAPSAEKVLIGENPSETLFARAADAVVACVPGAASMDCTPIDDFRGSSEYKRDMVKVLIRRTLLAALKEAIKD
ncbi:MAG: xanthine dehydrogenase family protein subunit M [Syntrophobacteraceae bacterium]|jgi:carbon-monoxide dehydrogenase medium subunit